MGKGILLVGILQRGGSFRFFSFLSRLVFLFPLLMGVYDSGFPRDATGFGVLGGRVSTSLRFVSSVFFVSCYYFFFTSCYLSSFISCMDFLRVHSLISDAPGTLLL